MKLKKNYGIDNYAETDIVSVWNQKSEESGFPGGSVVRNLPASVGDMGLIPGWGISLGEEYDNPLQYSFLGNLIDRGAQWATIHVFTKRAG